MVLYSTVKIRFKVLWELPFDDAVAKALGYVLSDVLKICKQVVFVDNEGIELSCDDEFADILKKVAKYYRKRFGDVLEIHVSGD